jgi:hypothetical protein
LRKHDDIIKSKPAPPVRPGRSIGSGYMSIGVSYSPDQGGES